MAANHILGIDIGSNSVGSSWVDSKAQKVYFGVSVFPAGVEESDEKRGLPKNHARRNARSQRKMTARKAMAKARLRKFLSDKFWMPSQSSEIAEWENSERYNPWLLREKGLTLPLQPFEFGKILLHMLNGRGAWWTDSLDIEQDEIEEKTSNEEKILKQRANATKEQMQKKGFRTFGQFIAAKYQERKACTANAKYIRQKVINRADALGQVEYEFCADRQMILTEFCRLWDAQKGFDGLLAGQLTDECKKKLYDPERTKTWKCQGLVFGQRNTYWDVKTLGRCDLEPTDRCCSKIDMYAQEFLVLQDVNNIRINPAGQAQQKLDSKQRQKVIAALRKQKTAGPATIRKALGINKPIDQSFYSLSTDNQNSINTSWFYREIVLGSIGETLWNLMNWETKDSINNAILKLNPESEGNREKFKTGCIRWWSLSSEQAGNLFEVWLQRPSIENRINLSQKAVKNLLPYMRQGYSVTEARQKFAKDEANGADDGQKQRYSLETSMPNRKIRRYMEKHPELLPPASDKISNPVVRKSIHEVRRHILAHMGKHGCKPDRVIVELAREARQTQKVINQKISRDFRINKLKERIKKEFPEYFKNISKGKEARIIERIRLAKQQKGACAYCERPVDPKIAADGQNLEVDHIIPRSRGGHNGLSNKVLCHVTCNQGKKNQTPLEWLDSGDFETLEQKFKHLKNKKTFDKNNPDMQDRAKWDNLHKKITDIEGFTESQLQATSYAATQIVDWIRDVLYDGERDGKRRVFATNGRYTRLLRNDWGLNFSNDKKDKSNVKNRADHRHHAVDALVIALTGPERIKEVAYVWEKYEMDKDEKPTWNKREPIKLPWGDPVSFHNQIKQLYDDLLVSHRPQKRKLVGPLHLDNPFGYIPGEKNKYVKGISAINLKPNHLRVPETWEHLREKMQQSRNQTDKAIIRRQMLNTEDVKPGKSGIVRDRWLREQLRRCLRENSLNPDNFSPTELKTLIGDGKLVLNKIPLKRVRILWTLTGVKSVRRKKYNPLTGKKEPLPLITDKDKKSLRVYQTQSNHHIEIRNKDGKWKGEVITTFNATSRVKPSKSSGKEPAPAVNRKDNENGKFVMSLSAGEMIRMRHPQTNELGYFVVFKIDSTGTIHFTSHKDAGRAKATDKCSAREDVKKQGNKTGGLNAQDIQKLGIENGKPPVKVCISPIGCVKELFGD